MAEMHFTGQDVQVDQMLQLDVPVMIERDGEGGFTVYLLENDDAQRETDRG